MLFEGGGKTLAAAAGLPEKPKVQPTFTTKPVTINASNIIPGEYRLKKNQFQIQPCLSLFLL